MLSALVRNAWVAVEQGCMLLLFVFPSLYAPLHMQGRYDGLAWVLSMHVAEGWCVLQMYGVTRFIPLINYKQKALLKDVSKDAVEARCLIAGTSCVVFSRFCSVSPIGCDTNVLISLTW